MSVRFYIQMLVVVLGAFSSSAYADSPPSGYKSYALKEALAIVNESPDKRMKIVLFFSGWPCSYCDAEKAFWKKDKVRRVFHKDEYLLVYVTWPGRSGSGDKELWEKYHVRGYPNLVFLDGSGKFLCVLAGGMHNPDDAVKIHKRLATLKPSPTESYKNMQKCTDRYSS